MTIDNDACFLKASASSSTLCPPTPETLPSDSETTIDDCTIPSVVLSDSHRSDTNNTEKNFYTVRRLQKEINPKSLGGDGKLLIVVNGKVYNVTNFANSHPGGRLAIEHMVGKDASDIMIAFHPPNVRKMLNTFYCGEFVGSGDDDSIDTDDDEEQTTDSSEIIELNKQSAADTNNPLGSLDNNIGSNNSELLFLHKAYPPRSSRSLKISENYRLLEEEMRARGKFVPNPQFYYKRFLLFAAMFALSIHLIVQRSSDDLFRLIAGAVLMGCMWHGASFTVHDLSHHSGFGSSRVDQVISIFFASFVGGLSVGWWQHNHNTHHIVTNDPEHDPDIQHLPFLAVTTRLFNNLYSSFYRRVMKFDLLARLFTSIQHFLFLPVLSFGRFNLYVQSLLFLSAKGRKYPYLWLELAGMAFYWTWFGYGLLMHGATTWTQRLLLLYISHASTALLHLQLTLSHFAMDTESFTGDEGFAELACRTTMNVDCPEWMDWLHGGLQFQLEHHLFPRVPRSNLRSIAPLIKQFCKDNQLEYHSYGFFKGNRKVFGTLQDVANQVKLLWHSADPSVRFQPHQKSC